MNVLTGYVRRGRVILDGDGYDDDGDDVQYNAHVCDDDSRHNNFDRLCESDSLRMRNRNHQCPDLRVRRLRKLRPVSCPNMVIMENWMNLKLRHILLSKLLTWGLWDIQK